MNFEVQYDAVPLFKKLGDLLKDHQKEVSIFEGEPLVPDWTVYKAMNSTGNVCVVTAHNDEGDIIGYTITVIARHLHYPFMIGTNDILYMAPKYRGHAFKLLRFTERELKRRGVKYFSLSIKPHVDFRPLVEKLGYNLFEYQYIRRL